MRRYDIEPSGNLTPFNKYPMHFKAAAAYAATIIRDNPDTPFIVTCNGGIEAVQRDHHGNNFLANRDLAGQSEGEFEYILAAMRNATKEVAAR
jgi:hypothetical protein